MCGLSFHAHSITAARERTNLRKILLLYAGRQAWKPFQRKMHGVAFRDKIRPNTRNEPKQPKNTDSRTLTEGHAASLLTKLVVELPALRPVAVDVQHHLLRPRHEGHLRFKKEKEKKEGGGHAQSKKKNMSTLACCRASQQ